MIDQHLLLRNGQSLSGGCVVGKWKQKIGEWRFAKLPLILY